MKNKYAALLSGVVVLSTLVLLFSCKKINDATELGGDLIPAVDNIHTFDTTLDVQVFNDTFSMVTDSTLSLSYFTQYLGKISNDPLFGKTDAQLFLELKPDFYPYTFYNKPDSLHIDSVVLILDYVETYGDTTADQTVNVYEIGSTARLDTTYRIREDGIPKAGLIGSRTFKPEILNDSIKAFEDTTANQLRIRLDDSFGQRLLSYDSVRTSGNGAYASDSAFKSYFKGFALESVSGNAVMGFNVNGTNTKLAIYYRDDNGDSPVEDTSVAYFTFTINCGVANLVKRDYSGTPLAAAAGGPEDNFVYIQGTPGSFATIKVPGLAGLNNRIIHRAELIMEQAYDPTDTIFPPPPKLYLDAYNPASSRYASIPYDFIVDGSTGQNNLDNMGGVPFRTTDGSGNNINVWHFDISRYIQHVVNGTEPVYDFRISAPTYIMNEYRLTTNADPTYVTIYPNAVFGTSGTPVKGRVRLYGGDATHTNAQRMRLRIVYSKI